MRRGEPSFQFDGIGNVTVMGKYVARLRYCLRHSQMVGDVQTNKGLTERAAPALTEGDIEVLESEASLYTDVLYTLHLEGKCRRECDFYSDPVDIVEGRYYIEVGGDLHEPLYRRT
jgi:hypothetical protein